MEKLQIAVKEVKLSEIGENESWSLLLIIEEETIAYEVHDYLNDDTRLSYVYQDEAPKYVLEIIMPKKRKILPIPLVVNVNTRAIMNYITQRKIIQIGVAFVAANRELRTISPSFHLIF